MNSLKTKYYGNNNVAVVLSKAAYLGHAFSNIRNKDGYFEVCNNSFEFKNFLPVPGLMPKDDQNDLDYYFDFYDEVKEFDLKAFVIDENNVYYDDANSIELFNSHYSTEFNTFDEVYNFASSDGMWDENTNSFVECGLGFSANVVDDWKLLEGTKNLVSVLYYADDCESVCGVLNSLLAEEIRSAFRHSDEPLACFELSDDGISKDNNYYVLIDNDEYDVVGLFSSLDKLKEYVIENDPESIQYYVCKKDDLRCGDREAEVLRKLLTYPEFENEKISLHLYDEDEDFKFKRFFDREGL